MSNAREILPPETSNEDLVRKFLEEEMTDYTGNGCKGNLADDCVQRSLREAAEILEGRTDSTLVGGLPAQLKTVDREGFETAWNLFSNRTTNDLDILSLNPREINALFRDERYSEGNLQIDTIDTGLFDDRNIGQKIVEESETVNIQNPSIGEVRIPSDTHLLYTKLHDGYARHSRGTRYDAWRMLDNSHFDVNESQLRELLEGTSKGMETYQSIADKYD
ncbi:MAG: hypothetical protein ABEJ56_04885 [Candidatus Nanohaloarchaea archaeon]